MPTLLDSLRFGTAIPFGYALLFGLCILLLIAGFVAALRFLFTQRYPAFTGAALLCAAAGLALYANIQSDVDWNPVIDDGLLVGGWTDADTSVTLKADGTGKLMLGQADKGMLGGLSPQIRWQRAQDFDVTLSSPVGDHSTVFRVISVAGQLRLIPECNCDPDTENPYVGLLKDPAVEAAR